jgi:hypothetical protein
MAPAGCFCCSLQRIISDRDLVSAEILSRRPFSERKNSKANHGYTTFYRCFCGKNTEGDIIARIP